jgi:ATP-dependent DNA helicase RecQ
MTERLGLTEAVRRVLGPDARLRESQRDALDGLATHDTLLVARSGAGKTAVYAIATYLTGRLTVVVSPLLALQRDQVEALTGAGLRAAGVSSTLTAAQQRRTLAAASAGRLDVLLLTPEQLSRGAVVDALRDVGLLVVDEAHCVSEWGHDFRPDYLHLGAAVPRLGGPRVLALTATASTRVRAEIVERLGLGTDDRAEPRVLVHDADRPNIWLGSRSAPDPDERDAAVVEAAVATGGPGIVYARTRAQVHTLEDALRRSGRPALAYHGGLPSTVRRDAQDSFLSGEADLIVATSAFGMGVDRPDVRFVLHAGPPPSLDAYYQEVGRAGRDEQPAVAVLVTTPEDFGLNHYLRSAGVPRAASVRAVLDAVGTTEAGATREQVAERSGLAARTTSRTLTALGQVGAVSEQEGRWRRAGGIGTDEVMDRLREGQERRRELERSRVELVRTYADTGDCRRRVLLELLGEEHPDRCGRCDSCDAGTSADVVAAPLRTGDRVRHAEWGDGTVSIVEADRVTVLFEGRGYVTLDLAIALESGVLVA